MQHLPPPVCLARLGVLRGRCVDLLLVLRIEQLLLLGLVQLGRFHRDEQLQATRLDVRRLVDEPRCPIRCWDRELDQRRDEEGQLARTLLQVSQQLVPTLDDVVHVEASVGEHAVLGHVRLDGAPRSRNLDDLIVEDPRRVPVRPLRESSGVVLLQPLVVLLLISCL